MMNLSMYEILKSTIMLHRYELSKMLKKIDSLWVQDDLTDEQREELTKLAQDNADPSMSLDFERQLKSLEERVAALEKSSGVKPEEYPEYLIGKWYYNGDGCTFEGERYKCIAPEGQVCTWSPREYPSYWEKVE